MYIAYKTKKNNKANSNFWLKLKCERKKVNKTVIGFCLVYSIINIILYYIYPQYFIPHVISNYGCPSFNTATLKSINHSRLNFPCKPFKYQSSSIFMNTSRKFRHILYLVHCFIIRFHRTMILQIVQLLSKWCLSIYTYGLKTGIHPHVHGTHCVESHYVILHAKYMNYSHLRLLEL